MRRAQPVGAGRGRRGERAGKLRCRPGKIERRVPVARRGQQEGEQVGGNALAQRGARQDMTHLLLLEIEEFYDRLIDDQTPTQSILIPQPLFRLRPLLARLTVAA